MRRETMTSRERWLALFHHQRPDRTPMDYWGTDEATLRIMKHLGCATKRAMLEKLRVDYAAEIKPEYVGPPLPPLTDVFGCRIRWVDYGSGAYDETITNPLAGFGSVAEIERNYSWPSPDWWDYGTLRRQAEDWESYPLKGGGSEPFLIYKKLRGQEQAFIDLIENPEIVHYCLDKLFGLAAEDTRRILETVPGRLTFTYVAEDLGGQTDLLFSLKHIREFLLPRMKSMIDLAHQAGVYAYHHDDGSCRRIVPELIEAGIDLLNPLQWRCPGMEREGLKKDFGSRIVLHGGVDNQFTLPFGTVADVRQEVLDNLRILGEGGGYILAPCHNIQPITPPENVVAMYETCYENGRL